MDRETNFVLTIKQLIKSDNKIYSHLPRNVHTTEPAEVEATWQHSEPLVASARYQSIAGRKLLELMCTTLPIRELTAY